MKRILIVYFSGVGATKRVAELMHCRISKKCEVDIFSIEDSAAFDMNDYDALIIGTPVFHGAPSRVVSDFFSRMHPLKKAAPAFIYNTRALCSCNTNRILAKQIKKKNINTVMDKDYRGPASDGALIAPYIKRFFEFEKVIQHKINKDCTTFLRLLHAGNIKGYYPRFRFSGIINSANKLAGQLITFKIFLHSDKCIRCGKCIEDCPHKAMKRSRSGFPIHMPKNCENCFRCIHRCPKKALSLSKRKTPTKVL